MSAPDLDLLVVGDCNPDVVVTGEHVTPVFSQHEQLVDGISLAIGGSAAITAVTTARLGLRVALVAAIGADPAGELMLSLLAREGVDTSGVLVRAGLATGMTTVLSCGGDRAILTALGAIATLTAADVPSGLLSRARHLHVSSYFLVEPSLGPGLAGLFGRASAAGLSTSLDTNDDPAGQWGGELLRAALAQVDVFLPNEAEALAISGQPDLVGAATALRQVGPATVVKLGARGALCVPSGREVGAGAGGDVPLDLAGAALVGLPPVRAVDTTGAGDCFNAGLIAGLLAGLDLSAAAAVGCAVGGASTQAPGGTGASIDAHTAFARARSAVVTRATLPG